MVDNYQINNLIIGRAGLKIVFPTWNSFLTKSTCDKATESMHSNEVTEPVTVSHSSDSVNLQSMQRVLAKCVLGMFANNDNAVKDLVTKQQHLESIVNNTEQSLVLLTSQLANFQKRCSSTTSSCD